MRLYKQIYHSKYPPIIYQDSLVDWLKYYRDISSFEAINTSIQQNKFLFDSILNNVRTIHK